MSDPVLTSLCTICHINPPKYTCPRCKSRTCSLACSKRHKVWRDCNGVRDPTVFKPAKELRTPAGIDHDYNFISAIERGVERSDKHIIEDHGLVTQKELVEDVVENRYSGRGRGGRNHRGHGGRNNSINQRMKNHHGRDSIFLRAMHAAGVNLLKAPKGMRRNVDNKTGWSTKNACVNWQVEWIEGDNTTLLRKLLEHTPIGEGYAVLLEERKRAAMSESAKRQEKKRKATELEKSDKQEKRRKLEDSITAAERPIIATAISQDPKTTAWKLVKQVKWTEELPYEDVETKTKTILSGYYFYLLKPNTPASQPKVLIPLPENGTLETSLRNRTILEFPTIYVLTNPPNKLPGTFMLESEYLGEEPESEELDTSSEEEDGEEEDDDDDDDATSDSGSDGSSGESGASSSSEDAGVDIDVEETSSDEPESDDSMEEGEIP